MIVPVKTDAVKVENDDELKTPSGTVPRYNYTDEKHESLASEFDLVCDNYEAVEHGASVFMLGTQRPPLQRFAVISLLFRRDAGGSGHHAAVGPLRPPPHVPHSALRGGGIESDLRRRSELPRISDIQILRRRGYHGECFFTPQNLYARISPFRLQGFSVIGWVLCMESVALEFRSLIPLMGSITWVIG